MKLHVMVLGFNRPERLRAVLDAVNRYGPASLFVVVDGPRTLAEAHRVAETIATVDELQWDCVVHLRTYEHNVGVRSAMTAGVDEFFGRVEQGVILEDDCFPSADFFRFAETALERYRSNAAVGMVGGTNFLSRSRRKTEGIFTEGHIWGWGTWRDRWVSYRKEGLEPDDLRASTYYGPGWPYRRMLIEKARSGELDSWAIPWLHHLASEGMLCATPTVNLVSNVGHGPEGRHTTGGSRFANLPLYGLPPYIRFPDQVVMDTRYRRRYAITLRGEHALHRARRPVVNLVRGVVGHLPRRRSPQ